MKYIYINGEFVREDKKGKRIPISMANAINIATFINKGYSCEYIKNVLRMDNLNDVINFSRHYIEGDIIGLEQTKGLFSRLRERL